MNWRDLKIKSKLSFGFGGVLSLLTVSSLVGFYRLNVMGQNLNIVASDEAMSKLENKFDKVSEFTGLAKNIIKREVDKVTTSNNASSSTQKGYSV